MSIIIQPIIIDDIIMWGLTIKNSEINPDFEVAEYCGMDEDDYQIFMQRKYNGSMWDGELVFHNIENIKK